MSYLIHDCYLFSRKNSSIPRASNGRNGPAFKLSSRLMILSISSRCIWAVKCGIILTLRRVLNCSCDVTCARTFQSKVSDQPGICAYSWNRNTSSSRFLEDTRENSWLTQRYPGVMPLIGSYNVHMLVIVSVRRLVQWIGSMKCLLAEDDVAMGQTANVESVQWTNLPCHPRCSP